MAAEPSTSKKRRLDPETSVKEEVYPGANQDAPSRDKQTSGGELEKRSDLWEPFKRYETLPSPLEHFVLRASDFSTPQITPM